jgi:hypothetical protein
MPNLLAPWGHASTVPQGRRDGTVVVEGVIRLWVTEKPAREAAAGG